MILLPLLLAGAGALDARVELYAGEVAVDPTTGAARPPIVRALNQVLVRLTGRVDDDLVAELGVDVAAADRLALGRQFRRKRIPDDDGGSRERRVLRVDFDAAAIDRLLAREGLPRWGDERPSLLFWIVEDSGRGADYVVDRPVLEHAIDEASFRYGIALTRPILDAGDRLEVSPGDVRGGFTGVSVPAARRYGTDGVVMLDLRRNGSFWTGRWVWRIGGEESAFERSGADRAEVIDLGLGRIAESLAGRFAARPADRRVRRLVVSGVDSNAHYDEVRRFLGRLTGVDSVRVAAARGSNLTFEIEVSTDRLRERIELTGPLAFERLDLVSDVLYYRFRL